MWLLWPKFYKITIVKLLIFTLWYISIYNFRLSNIIHWGLCGLLIDKQVLCLKSKKVKLCLSILHLVWSLILYSLFTLNHVDDCPWLLSSFTQLFVIFHNFKKKKCLDRDREKELFVCCQQAFLSFLLIKESTSADNNS